MSGDAAGPAGAADERGAASSAGAASPSSPASGPPAAPVAARGTAGAAAAGADRGASPGRWPLEPGERVLLERRPHPADVPLSALGFTVIALVVAASMWGLALTPGVAIGPGVLGGVLLAALAGRLAWGELERRCRRFVLTDRRVLVRFGVLRRHLVAVSLRRVQHVAMTRRLRDRLAGIGSVGVATAGTGGFDLAWVGVRDPEAVLARIESAAAAARAVGWSGD